MNPALIEKLRKILTLANDRGAQPGEVEAAMAKAREIALANDIELASIDLSTDDKAKAAIQVGQDDTLKTNSKYRQPYHRYIFGVLKQVFHVEVIQSTWSEYNGTRITGIILVGELTDITIAKAVYPFLEKVFPAALRRLVNEGYRECAATVNGCYNGLYWGIIDANKREEAKAQATAGASLALVLRKKEDLIAAKMNELFPNLKHSKSRAQQMSDAAKAEGYAQGRRINLRQLNGTSASSLKG